jgi:uncharacterized protein YlxP (DUF503 family)
MRIGSITVEIEIPGAQSLKDKRQVVRSILDKVRAKFNVSAAEVDQLNSWQLATLGFVVVSNDETHDRKVLAKVVDTIEAEPRCQVLDIQEEMI